MVILADFCFLFLSSSRVYFCGCKYRIFDLTWMVF